MPVSKKRKKDGKAVHRTSPVAAKEEHTDHPEGHPSHAQQKAGKAKNPFIARQPQVRGAQRGR